VTDDVKQAGICKTDEAAATAARIATLEGQLRRLQIRTFIAEMIFATLAAIVIRVVGEERRKEFMTELRGSISVEQEGFPDPDNVPIAALEAEEQAARLLDKIEHFARVGLNPKGGGVKGARRSPQRKAL
jgi:hypothetical protein